MADFPQIHAAWQRRRALVREQRLDAWRLVHGAADGMEGLSVDDYRGRYLITVEAEAWLEDRAGLEAALAEVQEELRPAFAPKFYWVANLPKQRGALPGEEIDRFEVVEDGSRFEVHLGEGPHTGLFLDQRENRREVCKLAKGRRCLNLFCHTGAFTVAALQGGASEAVSVDLSKNYLAWLERNLELNELEDRPHRSVASDAAAYLERAARGGEVFDLVILDPPTFGRGKGSTFSTIRDYGRLLAACLQILSPTGRILACLNTRKVAAEEFRDFLKEAAKTARRKVLRRPAPPPDFPETAGAPGALKAYWIA
ncbi:class I SAM-dependent rRNA methyltransferase [Deltaproteobacteria bacterium PRO3]|nr:class I SAM-dependent rRNA methyltransferase [Deltaproteobacteria bacterium PRO3]